MDPSDSLLIGARTIHLMSSALVAGALSFASLVAEPAFRSGFEAPLADRFRKWSVGLVSGALLLAFLSGAVWLVLLAQRIGDQPLTDPFGETTWALLTQTQFGTVWQFRFACAVTLGVLLFALMRQGPRPSGALDRSAAAVSAIFVGTLAWSGHGGATPGNAGYIHTAADILHLIAAAAWVGGLVPLVTLVRLGLRGRDVPERTIATNVLRGFSNLGVVSVAIVLVTGIVNLWFVVGSTDQLTETSYGRLLLFKIVLFAGMLGLAAVNRLRLMPWLAASDDVATNRPSRALYRIQRNAVAEIALGAVIFFIVGVLGLLEPVAHPHVHVH